MRHLTTVIFTLVFSVASLMAQQNVLDYSLLDYTEFKSLSFSTPSDTEEYLTDKDIASIYEVKNFSGELIIGFETNKPVLVRGYSFVSSDDETADPRDFKLEYSDNGTTWTRIGTSVFGHRFQGRHNASIITLNNNSSSSKYRIVISAINGGADLKIAELQIFGYPAALDTDLTKTEAVSISGSHNGSGSNTISNLLSDDLNQIFRQDNQRSCQLEYTFENPVKVEAYSLISTAAHNAGNMPRSWQLSASNDGENWSVLDVRTNKYVAPITNNMQVYRLADSSEKMDWAACADYLQEKMTSMFRRQYGSNFYLNHSYHPNSGSVNTGFNYWWMAHAIDTYIDAYARTGDEDYKTKMRAIYNVMRARGGNSLKNGFFDDMEWMALACIRANEVEPENPIWKDAAIQLWDWTKLGWNDIHGGGIQWVDVQLDSKNACSNAPAIIMVARLYNLTGEQDYLDWAHRIFDWMNESLILSNGMVKDSYTNDDWVFTYNQGTWIGACLEMYKITNDRKYYDIAMRTADYILDDYDVFSPYGVLYNNEGGGDGGLFKGILMRYLSQWILSGKLDEQRQERFINYFISNGKSVWQSALDYSTGIVGNTWFERRSPIAVTDDRGSGYDSSIHLSAVMLFELLDELERNGFITEQGLAVGVVENTQQEYKHYRLDIAANNGGNAIELARWQLFSSLEGTNIKGIQNIAIPVKIYSQNKQLVMQNESSDVFTFDVFDLQGKTIQTGELISSKEIQLKEGVYIVNVRNATSNESQKVVIF